MGAQQTGVASGLQNPWGLAFIGNGEMLVTERPGRMRVVGADGKTGFVMEQNVVLDTDASRAPSSIQLEGTNLLVAFLPKNTTSRVQPNGPERRRG